MRFTGLSVISLMLLGAAGFLQFLMIETANQEAATKGTMQAVLDSRYRDAGLTVLVLAGMSGFVALVAREPAILCLIAGGFAAAPFAPTTVTVDQRNGWLCAVGAAGAVCLAILVSMRSQDLPRSWRVAWASWSSYTKRHTTRSGLFLYGTVLAIGGQTRAFTRSLIDHLPGRTA